MSVTRDEFGQILAVDEFHHERADAGAVFDAVDGRDVRMIQRRERLGFAGESREPIGVAGERLGQHLQGDVAIEFGVLGAIDRALADFPGDLVGPETGPGAQRHRRTLWMAATVAVDYSGVQPIDRGSRPTRPPPGNRQLARRFARSARTAGTSLTGIFIAVDVVNLYADSSSTTASSSFWFS